MAQYKSPNVLYLHDPVLTTKGRGIIRKFTKALVWVELDTSARHRPGHLFPVPYREIRRLV